MKSLKKWNGLTMSRRVFIEDLDELEEFVRLSLEQRAFAERVWKDAREA